MTAQRRSRNGVTGRKKQRQNQQQQQRQRRRSQSTTDEGSSDEGSTTRCLCGETHNSGLMVQCDKCEVWQHCECMGLAEEDIPDQYYCEECKPENHASSKMPNGRTRRSYSSEGKPTLSTVDKKAPKKRMTMNSQEASLSLEDVLAVRQALGFNTNPRSSKSPSTSPTAAYEESHYVSGLTAKRKRQESSSKAKNEYEDIKQDSPSPPTLPPISETTTPDGPDDGVESKGKKQKMEPDEEDTVTSKTTSTPRSTKAKRNAAGRSRIATPNDSPEKRNSSVDGKPASAKTTDKKARQGGATTGRRNNATNSNTVKRQNNRPRSRTSTPQPSELSSPLQSSATNQTFSEQYPHQHNYQQQQSCAKDVGSALFDHFSKEPRVSSSPAKIRYPTPRMTLSEMNRRAKQILEYITSVQVEMANKSSTFGNNNNNDDKNGHDGKIENNMADLSLSSQQKPIHPITTTTLSSKSNIHDSSSGNHTVNASGGRKTKEKPPASIVIPEERYHDGPSSSLSSASTIPLDENNPGSPRMDHLDGDNNDELSQAEEAISKSKQSETSLDIMDMLTGELIKFQRRFGTGSYSQRKTQSQQNEASSSSSSASSVQQQQLQDEGRVTRSGNNGVRLIS